MVGVNIVRIIVVMVPVERDPRGINWRCFLKNE